MGARWSIVALAIIAVLAQGCGTAIDRQERQWQAQRVASYRIEVLEVHSIWSAATYSITVKDGAVTEHTATCIPAPIQMGKCEVEPYTPEDYTVPALFALVRSRLQSETSRYTKVSFDPQYGFPSDIIYNHPEILDEDWRVAVQAFEVLAAP